jgi:hypothetical protein
MTFVQVVEHNPPIKHKKEHENLVLMPLTTFKLQTIKLPASLTHPLKATKG